MERRMIAVDGTVQGVGFRPFVYRLASDLALTGFVQNRAGGVAIEVEGDTDPLEQFLDRLVSDSPPLAQIDRLSWHRGPSQGDARFFIQTSDRSNAGEIAIATDVATCNACLADLLDPKNRRYRYPFTNCTNCGPRLTIVTGGPYDRTSTTMAAFEMCAACRVEYENPGDRRFHAQPNACPACGPRLKLLDCEGCAVETIDPLGDVAQALLAGKIAAIKGLGGYHLACDARNAAAAERLRGAKRRSEKPFAVMVPDAAAADSLCEMDEFEARLLASARGPIVLLKKRAGIDLPNAIAPKNSHLGVMLPYTPLHYLLLNDLKGVPLVMTSGNRADEPIAIDERSAVEQLAGIADIFLVHDRPIHVRCDDSVVRGVGGIESPVRRSRGYAPAPILLPLRSPATILAVGGQLKTTFALADGRRAILSHHLGDLDHLAALSAFRRDITLYEKLFALKPAVVAHDLHPDYASSRYAADRAASEGIKAVAVQHHHAHLASCMAENGLDEPVIGVTFDGSGLGTDGAVWGGEFLVGDYSTFRRAAHLRYVPMPGGEVAIREPVRMAAAYLAAADATCNAFERRVDSAFLRTIRTMLQRRFNSPPTSSAGRLFDAVASLIGVRDVATYEGQAAVELEWLASTASNATVSSQSGYPFQCSSSRREEANWAPVEIDVCPMVRAIAEDVDSGVDPAAIARKFHSSMVNIILEACCEIRKATGINAVALSGGVFMNTLLNAETLQRLSDHGFRVYRHRLVPANDGGLSLGQAAIAARRIATATFSVAG